MDVKFIHYFHHADKREVDHSSTSIIVPSVFVCPLYFRSEVNQTQVHVFRTVHWKSISSG